MARPSSYTQETAIAICERLVEGESLRSVCRDRAMPDKATVIRWLGKYEEFRDQYARAKRDSADAIVEELRKIAEDVLNGDVGPQEARTAADILKWEAGRQQPKKYGDRLHNVNEAVETLSDKTDAELDEIERQDLAKRGFKLVAIDGGKA